MSSILQIAKACEATKSDFFSVVVTNVLQYMGDQTFISAPLKVREPCGRESLK